MSIHSEKARALFQQGYNCSQAVFAAFCDETGLDQRTAVRIASSFGGGMGRMREVCGAVTGMFMVLGMTCGYDDPKDRTGRAEHYQRIRQMADQFREEYGSIVCRELLGLDGSRPEPEGGSGHHKGPCGEMVARAAELTDQYLDSHRAGTGAE